jgi:hypothetical protein
MYTDPCRNPDPPTRIEHGSMSESGSEALLFRSGSGSGSESEDEKEEEYEVEEIRDKKVGTVEKSIDLE